MRVFLTAPCSVAAVFLWSIHGGREDFASAAVLSEDAGLAGGFAPKFASEQSVESLDGLEAELPEAAETEGTLSDASESESAETDSPPLSASEEQSGQSEQSKEEPLAEKADLTDALNGRTVEEAVSEDGAFAEESLAPPEAAASPESKDAQPESPVEPSTPLEDAPTESKVAEISEEGEQLAAADDSPVQPNEAQPTDEISVQTPQNARVQMPPGAVPPKDEEAHSDRSVKPQKEKPAPSVPVVQLQKERPAPSVPAVKIQKEKPAPSVPAVKIQKEKPAPSVPAVKIQKEESAPSVPIVGAVPQRGRQSASAHSGVSGATDTSVSSSAKPSASGVKPISAEAVHYAEGPNLPSPLDLHPTRQTAPSGEAKTSQRKPKAGECPDMETLLSEGCPIWAAEVARRQGLAEVPIWTLPFLETPVSFFDFLREGASVLYLKHEDSVKEFLEALSFSALKGAEVASRASATLRSESPFLWSILAGTLAFLLLSRLLFGRFFLFGFGSKAFQQQKQEALQSAVAVNQLLEHPQMKSLFQQVKKLSALTPHKDGAAQRIPPSSGGEGQACAATPEGRLSESDLRSLHCLMVQLQQPLMEQQLRHQQELQARLNQLEESSRQQFQFASCMVELFRKLTDGGATVDVEESLTILTHRGCLRGGGESSVGDFEEGASAAPVVLGAGSVAKDLGGAEFDSSFEATAEHRGQVSPHSVTATDSMMEGAEGGFGVGAPPTSHSVLNAESVTAAAGDGGEAPLGVSPQLAGEEGLKTGGCVSPPFSAQNRPSDRQSSCAFQGASESLSSASPPPTAPVRQPLPASELFADRQWKPPSHQAFEVSTNNNINSANKNAPLAPGLPEEDANVLVEAGEEPLEEEKLPSAEGYRGVSNAEGVSAINGNLPRPAPTASVNTSNKNNNPTLNNTPAPPSLTPGFSPVPPSSVPIANSRPPPIAGRSVAVSTRNSTASPQGPPPLTNSNALGGPVPPPQIPNSPESSSFAATRASIQRRERREPPKVLAAKNPFAFGAPPTAAPPSVDC